MGRGIKVLVEVPKIAHERKPARSLSPFNPSGDSPSKLQLHCCCHRCAGAWVKPKRWDHTFGQADGLPTSALEFPSVFCQSPTSSGLAKSATKSIRPYRGPVQ